MNREKNNHLEHVQTFKANLLAERAKEVKELKSKLEKEKAEFQRTFHVPKELRKEVERLKVENKSLQKKADGNKAMKSEVPELKKLVATQEKAYNAAAHYAVLLEMKLENDARKSQELEVKNGVLETSYACAVEKVDGMEKLEKQNKGLVSRIEKLGLKIVD